ncbi:hypothetical protein ACFZBU_45920 [Embleya sp. NPDC008237]|uniref:hypothetical protein n=1 Tax=Embleya sp. NPDC008237 TaxID=3363978 RepID=UPI0036E5BD16
MAWADVETLVSWPVKHGSHRVGVVATGRYRHRTGLDTRRSGRWMNKVVVIPVSWTTPMWDGPPDEFKAMVAALWGIIPGYPGSTRRTAGNASRTADLRRGPVPSRSRPFATTQERQAA